MRKTSKAACGPLLLFLAAALAVDARADEAAEAKQAVAREGKAIVRALKKQNVEEAQERVKAVGALATPQAAEYLLTLASIRPNSVFAAVRDALAGDRSDPWQKVLLDFYQAESDPKKGNWQRRVLLLDAFARLPGDSALEALKLGVKDAHPKVRLAAIRALKVTEAPAIGVIPIAIDSLDASEKAHDQGTPHVEARTILFQQTGIDQTTAQAWKAYWEKNVQNFTSSGQTAQGSIRNSNAVMYYDSVVTSRRVLFIIDISDSMNFIDDQGWPNAPRVPKGITGTGQGADKGGTITDPHWNRWIRENPMCQRMRRAKAELSRLVKALPPDTYFNILAFNSGLLAWQPTMTPVTRASQESALKFIMLLEHKGATAADLALAEAFKNNYLADTIYFLSDGEPSRDGINDMPIEPLLEDVGFANRFHRIIIHTTTFGDRGSKFMKSLAESNGGTLQSIVGPPKWLHEQQPPGNNRRGG